MKLRLDTSKAYAIALEGGGAKGAYEVGVWRALDEADVRFDAVAGTSVGALNGAMMVMGELEQALRLWENIRFSQVFDADDEQLKKLYDHKLSEVDFRTLFKDVMEAIHEGGLDIEPLRRLIAEWVDEEKIRSSPKKLFLVTYSLTDKRELDMDADELEEGKLRDMLLAGEEYGAEWCCAGAISRKGHPHHPLYLRKDEKLRPFDVKAYLEQL